MSSKHTLLVVLGVAAFAAIVGGALFSCVRRSVHERRTVEEFFNALFTADADAVRAEVHPDIPGGEVIEPVLSAFAAGVREFYGDYRGLDARRWEVVTKVVPSGRTWVKCVVDFEKGSAEARVELLDQKVIMFNVFLLQMPREWTPDLDDLTPWREHGHAFLTAYAKGDAERAFAMMSPALQETATKAGFHQDMAEARADAGELEGIRFISEKPPRQRRTFDLLFEVKSKESEDRVILRYELGFFNGALVGLFPAEEAESDQ